MDGPSRKWHSHLMQERALFRRFGLVVLLSQALVLYGLAGAWAKAIGVPAAHAAAGGYLCALPDDGNSGPPQPLPADQSSDSHVDCLFMCAAAGSGAATAPTGFFWLPAGSPTGETVSNYSLRILGTPEPGAMLARGPPAAV